MGRPRVLLFTINVIKIVSVSWLIGGYIIACKLYLNAKQLGEKVLQKKSNHRICWKYGNMFLHYGNTILHYCNTILCITFPDSYNKTV